MDSNLNVIKAENNALRKLINNPQALLRKMGLVSVSTPFTDDLQTDPFRGDMDFSNNILKSNQQNITSISNEELHEMSWEDIHDMANDARGVAQ